MSAHGARETLTDVGDGQGHVPRGERGERDDESWRGSN